MLSKPILLWDIMETLVTEPFYGVMPEFFGMTLDELLEAKQPGTWIEFEKGKIDEQQFFDCFFADGRTLDGPALRQSVVDAYHWMDGMQSLLSELHQRGCQMHALSNYPIWYELIEQKLQVARYLQWTFVSCLTGFRKPDAQAFLEPIRLLGVEPGDCLFIDDRPINVEAARSLGMDAILKVDAQQVRDELVQRGLIAR